VDLTVFYRKIRQIEKEIEGDHAVVVSSETPDGGVSGRTANVPKAIAARLVVEGKARLATAEESERHHRETTQAIEAGRRRELLGRAQVRLLSDGDIEALRSALKPAKNIS